MSEKPSDQPRYTQRTYSPVELGVTNVVVKLLEKTDSIIFKVIQPGNENSLLQEIRDDSTTGNLVSINEETSIEDPKYGSLSVHMLTEHRQVQFRRKSGTTENGVLDCVHFDEKGQPIGRILFNLRGKDGLGRRKVNQKWVALDKLIPPLQIQGNE